MMCVPCVAAKGTVSLGAEARRTSTMCASWWVTWSSKKICRQEGCCLAAARFPYYTNDTFWCDCFDCCDLFDCVDCCYWSDWSETLHKAPAAATGRSPTAVASRQRQCSPPQPSLSKCSIYMNGYGAAQAPILVEVDTCAQVCKYAANRWPAWREVPQADQAYCSCHACHTYCTIPRII